jgi:hypothetical protein
MAPPERNSYVTGEKAFIASGVPAERTQAWAGVKHPAGTHKALNTMVPPDSYFAA